MRIAPPACVAPPRLEPAPRRKPESGPPDLTPKHRALIAAMVWGIDDDRVEHMTRRVQHIVDGEPVIIERPLRKGEPLELHEAAQLVGIRHRNARELMGVPVFHAAYTLEIQRMREGAKPMAMKKIIELRDRVGKGNAADGKLQLAASQAILGDAAGTKPAGVQVNVGVSVTPGYVIDLSDDGAAAAPVLTYDHGPAGSAVFSAREGETVIDGEG